MGGDQGQIEEIQRVSTEEGIPKSIQNVFGLSAERAELGLTKTSDVFTHMLRTTYVENKKEFDEYIGNPNKYITVLRITPPRKTVKPKPFPPHIFKQRISEPESVPSENLTHDNLTSIVANDLGHNIISCNLKRLYSFSNKKRDNNNLLFVSTFPISAV